MQIDSSIRFTKIKGQPHLHLYMSELEYALLNYPNKIITNLADFYNIFIKEDKNNIIFEYVRKAFESGINYIKIDIDK